MTVFFVTGTDTEVGKTVLTAALAALLRARERSVVVVKPAQTGVAAGEPGDLDQVRRLAGPVDVIEGVRLPEPLAPNRAAAEAGIDLPTLAQQRDLLDRAAGSHDDVIVEGAGGVLVRLGTAFTLLDLGAALPDIDWLVVARAGLGTLNHSALTVAEIARRGGNVQGVVIGSWPADPGLADRHNRTDLPSYTGVPVLGAIPAGAGALAPAVFQAQAASWLPGLDLPGSPQSGPDDEPVSR